MANKGTEGTRCQLHRTEPEGLCMEHIKIWSGKRVHKFIIGPCYMYMYIHCTCRFENLTWSTIKLPICI